MATSKIVIPKFDDILYTLCLPENEDFIKDSIETIESHRILQEVESEVLKAYKQIYQTTGSVPSHQFLLQSIPSYRCQSTTPLTDIMSSIRLFVKDRLNKQVSNQLIDIASQVTSEGVTENVTDKLNALMNTDATTIKFVNVFDEIDEIYNRTTSKSGIRVDNKKIDDIIGGLKPGQLSTVAAFTGGGKSTFSVCVMHSALKQGFNVCYLSLELSADHLLYNLISRHSVEADESGKPIFRKAVVHSDMKNKTLASGDWQYIQEEIIPSIEKLPGKAYILDEQQLEARTFFAFNNKLQEVEKLAEKETGHGIDLLIVDHIQMLQFSDDNSRQNENTIINKWVNYFRSQSLDFLKSKRQIHVLMCAQINRQGFMRAVKHEGMYDLTSLKEANEIETASSIIISLFTDPALQASKEIKFGILKNRDGNRTDTAEPIYCDFEHYMIGGDNITSDQEFATLTMEDLVAAGNSNINVSSIQQEMSLFDEEDLPF